MDAVHHTMTRTDLATDTRPLPPALSGPLAVFVSSAVRNFAAQRQEIAQALLAKRLTIHLSEDPEFPVTQGAASHDACLAVVRRSHVFVLLVGDSSGGEYREQNKSITWRE